MNKYCPRPVDTTTIQLPMEVKQLIEDLAENTHETWAQQRLKDGWIYGERRDDEKKTHPCLIPYSELPESEKVYDRNTATAVLKCIMALGYKISIDA